MSKAAKLWQFWIDTGGTFTDCIAVDPAGKMHRTKVLSSSALRGACSASLAPDLLQIRQSWAAPDEFVRGYEFRLPGGAALARITGFSASRRELRLDRRLEKELPPGTVFELSSDEPAPILAARLATRTPSGAPLPAGIMRLATTRGTNALLERKGARVALFITQGFEDLLLIGTQQRPNLFTLKIEKPAPLYETVIGVPERLAADGRVLRPLDLESLGPAVAAARARGVHSAAIALLHSYRNPAHEHALAAYLQQAGFTFVVCSADLAQLIKILPRAETAVVDAYLGPVIEEYLAAVSAALPAGRLQVMTSAGGLVSATGFRAKDSLLSGPAGGVAGAAAAARASGFEKIISFDMGGTSTDVARYDGRFEYVFEHRVGDAHLYAPALSVETVAAGGGSVCWFDGARLRVGPQSAGASPGPACYGAGGPLTITDANMLLGRLPPAHFGIPVDPDKAKAALAQLVSTIQKKTRHPMSPTQILAGYLDIANERMAEAIRGISLRRGYAPEAYALLAFGGAGGQHACAVARLLRVRTIIIPPEASLLSALGLGSAVVERFAERQILRLLEDPAFDFTACVAELSQRARAAVQADGMAAGEVRIRRVIVNLRFTGQAATIPIDYEARTPLRYTFIAHYRQLYGYQPEERPIEVESIRVIAASQAAAVPKLVSRRFRRRDDDRSTHRRVYLAGTWRRVPCYFRKSLRPGEAFPGPALVIEPHTCVLVETGWHGVVDRAGALLLQSGLNPPA